MSRFYPPPPDTTHNDSVKFPSKPEKSESTKSPRDLACYRAFFSWRADAITICPSCLPLALEILKNLSAGYFEFSRERKVEFYLHARELLAHLWVELELLKTSENNGVIQALSHRLNTEVIPALSGALRKIEGQSPKNPSRH